MTRAPHVPTVEFIYGGGDVRRFHTIATTQTNTVAQHSFGVAWMVALLCDGCPSTQLLMAALGHDLAEQYVGDIPSPTKRELKISEKLGHLEDTILHRHGAHVILTADEKRTLKIADCLDGMMFCVSELRSGNRRAHIIYERYLSYIEEMGGLTGAEVRVLGQVKELHRLEL